LKVANNLFDIAHLQGSLGGHYVVHVLVFGKVGRCALDDVIVELLKNKCLPSLLYGIETCPVNKSVIKSLEFVINNAFRKIIATTSCDIANECVLMFICSVYDMMLKRKSKFF